MTIRTSVVGLSDGPGGSVAQRVVRGTFWVLLAYGTYRALGFATNLVLARLLDPADFGLVSFAMIVIGAFTLLQDLGVPAALIYGKYSASDLNHAGGTALTINVATALVLCGLTVLVAPALAAAGDNAGIAPVATILALGLVVQATGSVHGALLMKDLAFGRKFIPEVVPLFASGIISIALAFMGFGVWSLVYGYLAKSAAYSALLWAMSPERFWPSFRWPVARSLLHYGQHVSFSAVIGFVLMNVDYFIVGHALGAAALGVYTVAFIVANLPSTAVSQVISTVTFPAYAQVRDDGPALIRLFSDVFVLVSAVTTPLGLALVICAPAFAPLVLGEKWVGIAQPLQVLLVFGVLRAMEYTFAPVFKAVGRPELAWRFHLMRLAVLVPLLVIAVRQGITAVAVVQVAVAMLFIPFIGIVAARVIGIPGAGLLRLVAGPLAGAAAMGLLVLGTTSIPQLRSMRDEPIGAAGLTVAALALYAIVLHTLNPRVLVLGLATCGSLLHPRR